MYICVIPLTGYKRIPITKKKKILERKLSVEHFKLVKVNFFFVESGEKVDDLERFFLFRTFGIF